MNSPESRKHYETARARVAAMYQVPTASRRDPRTLELYVDPQRRVVDDNWPAMCRVSCRLTKGAICDGTIESSADRVVECRVGIDANLPFLSAAFDLVVLHYTLDGVPELTPDERPHAVTGQLLREIVRVVDKGGLVAGCTRNASVLQRLLATQRPSARSNDLGRTLFTPAACARALDHAGLGDIAVFNVLPAADNPRALVSIKAQASRRAFRRELEASRDALSPSGYTVRRVIAELALNRYLEPDLFFFGYRTC